MVPHERIILLFCHGGSFNKEIWTPILRRLQATPLLERVQCEYVTFDWRYHGSQSTDVDPATIYYEDGDKSAPRVEHPAKHWPEWAPLDLVKIINELRTDDNVKHRTTRFVGIGHSMGAATLLNVEVHSPGTFSGLVLFEPPFAIGERPESLKWVSSMMVIVTLAREEEWNTWTEVFDHFQRGKLYRRWHPESLAAFLEGGIKRTDDGTRFRLAMPLIQESSLYCHELMCYTHDELAKVACPVVFEYGDHSQLFNLPEAQEVVNTLPDVFSLAEPLEGKTHLTVAEDPDMCATHIVTTLEKLPLFQKVLTARESTTSKL